MAESLLYLPAPRHQETLLGLGLCGACPSLAWHGGERQRVSMGTDLPWEPCAWVPGACPFPPRATGDEFVWGGTPFSRYWGLRVALVLMWEGEIAIESCDRLFRLFLNHSESGLARPSVHDVLLPGAFRWWVGQVLEPLGGELLSLP